MEKIIVLLSTYNGKKYLAQQLDSIFKQINVEPHILIRDDGSADDTVRLIEQYISKFPNRITLIKGENIGWRASFMALLDYTATNCHEYQYVAFCDQDDIWLPEKLSTAIRAIGQTCNPVLYCSNLYYYEDGINKGLVNPNNYTPTVKTCLVRNYATGCTIVFNLALLRLLGNKTPDMVIAHDLWAYMVATLCGKVIVDSQSYILYRQHPGNQIGAKRGHLQRWKRRITSIRRDINLRIRENAAREIIRLHARDMHPEALDAAKKIALYRQSLRGRLSLLFDNGFTIGRKSNDFYLKLRILFGRL